MSKKKILLVEDSAVVLQLEQIMLEKSYELLTATTGTEGLARALNERPDLILLDVMIPKLDGIELCRLLRGIEATRAIPIVMVTTLADQKTQEAAAAAGCDDFVSKPIDRHALVTKIERLLSREPGPPKG